MDTTVIVYNARTLDIVHSEIINHNLNPFVVGLDVVKDEAYTLYLRDTSKIKKGNLISSDISDEVFYIDKVYEEKITYKSILELFNSEIYYSSEVRLDIVYELYFKTNQDPLANYPYINLISDVYLVIYNAEDGKPSEIISFKDLVIKSLYNYNQHIRTEISNGELNIYVEPKQTDLFINTLATETFVSIDLPDISNTFTTCTIETPHRIEYFYLLKDNTITQDPNNSERYDRVKNRYREVDENNPGDIDLFIIAREELVDTDDYLATIVLLVNSPILEGTNFYIGDSLTLNKEDREVYTGTITGLENNGKTLTIKIGFDREEYIFRKEF